MRIGKKIVMIGAGKLGHLIARRVLQMGICNTGELWICRKDETRLAELTQLIPGCRPTLNLAEAIRDAELVILAVKPADLAAVSADLRPLLTQTQTVLSVVTGKSFSTLAKHLGTRQLVRASTSILAGTGQARTVYMIDPRSVSVSPLAVEVIHSWGESLETVVENDIKTAIVAIGALPGLVAYSLLGFVSGIEAEGWSRQESLREVLLSTQALCQKVLEQNLDLADIVRSVATKGGITQAGVEAMSGDNLQEAIARGIRAAIVRTEELDG